MPLLAPPHPRSLYFYPPSVTYLPYFFFIICSTLHHAASDYRVLPTLKLLLILIPTLILCSLVWNDIWTAVIAPWALLSLLAVNIIYVEPIIGGWRTAYWALWVGDEVVTWEEYCEHWGINIE